MSSVIPADSAGRRMRLVRRGLIGLMLLVVVGYAAAVAHLMMSETELIFRTNAARVDIKQPPFAYTQVDIPRSDGASQFAWRIQASNDNLQSPGEGGPALRSPGEGGWILFLHGNASTVASR